ncbi:MAG: tetratricopeptide repeat protein [Phycisphaerales bacterium]|nr:tetratricopeptide repeat protein [Phycisphaerales bacterium]
MICIRVLCLALLVLAGCTGPRAAGPYQPATEARRDPQLAQELTKRAAPLMDEHPDDAERLLREALTADLYHGPAHNNLGVLLLRRGDLYGAASEFEFGSRLMPGHPDPRVNLAITLECAGRTGDAIHSYESALAAYPGYLPAMQGLARLQVRAGRVDERTPGLLSEIALRGEGTEWREWAARQRALRQ